MDHMACGINVGMPLNGVALSMQGRGGRREEGRRAIRRSGDVGG